MPADDTNPIIAADVKALEAFNLAGRTGKQGTRIILFLQEVISLRGDISPDKPDVVYLRGFTCWHLLYTLMLGVMAAENKLQEEGLRPLYMDRLPIELPSEQAYYCVLRHHFKHVHLPRNVWLGQCDKYTFTYICFHFLRSIISHCVA